MEAMSYRGARQCSIKREKKTGSHTIGTYKKTTTKNKTVALHLQKRIAQHVLNESDHVVALAQHGHTECVAEAETRLGVRLQKRRELAQHPAQFARHDTLDRHLFRVLGAGGCMQLCE
jgi:hypothetical protein